LRTTRNYLEDSGLINIRMLFINKAMMKKKSKWKWMIRMKLDVRKSNLYIKFLIYGMTAKFNLIILFEWIGCVF
jgi:maltose-binding protein MalE